VHGEVLEAHTSFVRVGHFLSLLWAGSAPRFERVNYIFAELSGGSAALVGFRIPCNIIEHSLNQLQRTGATHSGFWSGSLCILVVRSSEWVMLTMPSKC
jgi:hypothetical protein